jgi:hypothetical protein
MSIEVEPLQLDCLLKSFKNGLMLSILSIFPLEELLSLGTMVGVVLDIQKEDWIE